jgi:hypothetical protein
MSKINFVHIPRDTALLVRSTRKSANTSSSGHNEHNKRITVYRAADKSLARPGRKQPRATEDFEFHVSYL